MEALKILLNLGIDVNALATRSGETAMHGAAARGADLIVQFLADHGANVNVQDKQGRTPIDAASGVGAGVGGVRSPHDSTVALLAKPGGEPGPPAAADQPEGAGNGCGIPKDSGTCQRTEACLASVE